MAIFPHPGSYRQGLWGGHIPIMGVGGGEAPWPERGRPQVGEKPPYLCPPATSSLPLASADPSLMRLSAWGSLSSVLRFPTSSPVRCDKKKTNIPWRGPQPGPSARTATPGLSMWLLGFLTAWWMG